MQTVSGKGIEIKDKMYKRILFPTVLWPPSQKHTGIVSVWFKINNEWTKGNVVCLLLSWLHVLQRNRKGPKRGAWESRRQQCFVFLQSNWRMWETTTVEPKSRFQEPQTDTRDFPGPDPSHSKSRETSLTSMLRSLELTRFLWSWWENPVFGPLEKQRTKF